jgi:hypothetical protein
VPTKNQTTRSEGRALLVKFLKALWQCWITFLLLVVVLEFVPCESSRILLSRSTLTNSSSLFCVYQWFVVYYLHSTNFRKVEVREGFRKINKIDPPKSSTSEDV